MVKIYIDESGQFTPAIGYSLVCSLAVPHKSVGPASRELNRVSVQWPRHRGELKGGSIQAAQLHELVDVLYRHDGILHCCAIDVSRENEAEVHEHQKLQAEGITRYLASADHPNFVEQVWVLRRMLERMPPQLYVQCVLMTALVCSAVEDVALYFAQRRPRELGRFEWVIDAKDPTKVTTQESWWLDTLGPLIESRSQDQPFGMVRDPNFDYRFLNRSFEFEKELWHPDRPRETVQGIDIRKLITSETSFVDSRKEILIQAVDVLTSFLRRVLQGAISDRDVIRCLGRLQIIRRRQGSLQSVQLLTLSAAKPPGKQDLARCLRTMTAAGRSMLKKPPRD